MMDCRFNLGSPSMYYVVHNCNIIKKSMVVYILVNIMIIINNNIISLLWFLGSVTVDTSCIWP